MQSPKIGGTYKVSTEMLTPFLLPSVLTVSGFVSLAYEPITAVSPTWLLSGVFGFYTDDWTRHRRIEPLKTPTFVAFNRKPQTDFSKNYGIIYV